MALTLTAVAIPSFLPPSRNCAHSRFCTENDKKYKYSFVPAVKMLESLLIHNSICVFYKSKLAITAFEVHNSACSRLCVKSVLPGLGGIRLGSPGIGSSSGGKSCDNKTRKFRADTGWKIAKNGL